MRNLLVSVISYLVVCIYFVTLYRKNIVSGAFAIVQYETPIVYKPTISFWIFFTAAIILPPAWIMITASSGIGVMLLCLHAFAFFFLLFTDGLHKYFLMRRFQTYIQENQLHKVGEL
ncbi:hypothetical protein MUG87_19130 [Ectobacillus sp. JY-23]|uniref:hypothetical protein n=1 Tax=Ectobacillus sp. JY-23 TaxID=2933872 RepID=UPI001FF247A8|nr:hypothetical protein [Ectobacillus sp. JY-23]UOY92498.1 hypothetical protein MUG87_19130 [Ectobacillus sp. JY-23]